MINNIPKIYNGGQPMNMMGVKYTSQKRALILLFAFIFVLGFASATVETLGVFKQNSCIELLQSGVGFSHCNITSVRLNNQTSALGETPMTKIGIEYNVTFCDTKNIGQYIVNGFCTNTTDVVAWSYDFDVTTTGEKVSLSNGLIVIVFLILAGVFLFLGKSFADEHWILKTFFNFCAVLMGILSVSSAKVIASESLSLGTLADSGLTIMVAVFSIFFLYMFVYVFIETIKALREKKGVNFQQ